MRAKSGQQGIAIITVVIIVIVVIIAVAVIGTLIWAASDAANSPGIPDENGRVCHSKCVGVLKYDCATGSSMGACFGIWACDDPVTGVNDCL